jgi:hypothetical protein
MYAFLAVFPKYHIYMLKILFRSSAYLKPPVSCAKELQEFEENVRA